MELSKCKFHIFAWKFDIDGNAIFDESYNRIPTTIRDSITGENLQVQAIPAAESYKLLGVEIRVDGKSAEQEKSLADKCFHFSKALTRLSLPHSETLVGYKCVIAPSI